MSDFPDVRLHVVSGKGGTGKTTVAAALSLALASGGIFVIKYPNHPVRHFLQCILLLVL